MTEFVLRYEAPIRLSFFFGVVGVMTLWELLAPRRALSVSKTLRWTSNLGIVVLNTLVLRAVFPVAAVGMALLAAGRGWGLLNAMELHDALAGVVAVVLCMIPGAAGYAYLGHAGREALAGAQGWVRMARAGQSHDAA